jgi:hypothetical protein
MLPLEIEEVIKDMAKCHKRSVTREIECLVDSALKNGYMTQSGTAWGDRLVVGSRSPAEAGQGARAEAGTTA